MPETTTRTPQPGDMLPFTATEATLANGLKVIVVPTGFPNLVSVQIPVQTGSRNEVEPGKSGFAHFFEHMMFRGTKRFPADEYQAIITRTGARQNAYTTDDYTNYHITFAKEDLETILDLEADRFMNLEYSEAAFKTESRAVLGEYNKSSSEPLNKLIEVQRDTAFTTHPYKHTTMGFLRDIEDMPNQFEYSRTFFERWYRPGYTTVIVAGDVDPAETIALVEKYWGKWDPGQAADVGIPSEPPAEGPELVHVPWPTETLPWVTVAFHGPAFSDTDKDYAALDTTFDLLFGETSDLYQRLVEREQKVDQLFPYMPANQDPELATIMARVKSADDAVYVRDLILETVAQARAKAVDAQRLADAKSHNRYSFARAFDNSETIAGTLARFVRYERDYGTLNRLFEVYDSLTPEDLQAASRRYLTDANMVITTLAHGELTTASTPARRLAELERKATPAGEGAAPRFIVQASESSLLRMKLLFTVGSAHDPEGKEGLARLAASMITEAGSQRMRIDEINRALFPLAAGIGAQVDREMTTFTGVAHVDTLERFLDIALPQLLEPGFREDDFARLKEQQRNSLVQDLRANNEEELGKERLQQLIFEGTAYGHPTLGIVSGIDSITLDDVKAFIADHYTTANLTVGLSGAFPEGFQERLEGMLAGLGAGTPATLTPLSREVGRGAGGEGLRVEIIEKETRSTAISFGHPIEVTRSHPDFAALWLARAYLGEHRASVGRLYNRIRELRGMNYGDYAYIEAFPRGMYQFQPDPNIARRAQIFEVWIRPVPPEQGLFALKLALFELQRLINDGLSEENFEATREYLSKNVFVMTKTQDQQLGYALDQEWYGLPEYTGWMREQLAALTRDRVNDAVRRHLSATDLQVVMITKDAAGLRDELLSDADTAMTYDAPKPEDVLAEDRLVGSRRLGLLPEDVVITPVESVFA